MEQDTEKVVNIKKQIKTLSFTEKAHLRVWMDDLLDKDRSKIVEEKKEQFEKDLTGFVKKGAEFIERGARKVKEHFDVEEDSDDSNPISDAFDK